MCSKSLHLLLPRCATLKELQHIHGQALIKGLHPHHQPLSCQILNAYAGFGDASDAHNLFDEIPQPDLVSITSLMSLFIQINDHVRALSLFSQLMSSGMTPDGFAIVGALSASAKKGDLRAGEAVHGIIFRYGLGYETVVGNALIDMYCRNGRIQLAQMAFHDMGVRDSVTWNCMLHAYIKCCGLESACRFFDEMPERDMASWTVMITGHVQQKHPVRALELFRRMKSKGHSPVVITIVGVLSACADIGALDLGRAIHGHINKTNLGHRVTVGNALIDMYAKSGNVGMAYQAFNMMLYRDVFSWTSMISGLAVHGDGKQAIELFSRMLESGVCPNEVTFLAILSVCSHAGLIDEGRKWLEIMVKVYGLTPQIKHYGCMIDLLGRAGLLDEAKSLIGNIDGEPDTIIWRSLLSACLAHGDVQLAEVAAKEIIKREPEDDGVHVLLWNMYASSNRWKEALEMRKKMWSRKIIKEPGYSWIELDGSIHEFLVEDRMHYHRNEIYVILEGLAKNMKLDGTLPFSEENDKDSLFQDSDLIKTH